MDGNADDDLPIQAEPVLEDDTVGLECVSDVQTRNHKTKRGTPWRNYACRHCANLLFTSQGLLRWHGVQMHRPYKCQKCDVVFIGRRNFSQHVRKEHPGLPISKVFTACTGTDK